MRYFKKIPFKPDQPRMKTVGIESIFTLIKKKRICRPDQHRLKTVNVNRILALLKKSPCRPAQPRIQIVRVNAFSRYIKKNGRANHTRVITVCLRHKTYNY